MAASILIYNGRIVADSHFLPRGYVLIRDERIASIGTSWEEIKAEQEIDAGGLIVSPGFIDMHTHGILDLDFMESPVEQVLVGLKDYARFGVTRVVGSTLSNPMAAIIAQVKNLRTAMMDREIGALLHGVHIEGPWLAPRCRGGHAQEYLRIPEKEDVHRLLGEVGDVIRTVTFAPELPNSVWLAEQLTRQGIVGVLGHTEASFEDAERVILAGARHVTHMYDTTMGYKENPQEALVMMPGMETAVLLNDAVSIELIGCPVHVPLPFFRFIDKIKPRDKKVIVSDSLVGTGRPDGTELVFQDGHRVFVKDGVLRMIDNDPQVNGNLTGSAVTLNMALRRLTEYAGIPIQDAIRWGSINPATTLGIEHETGSLRIGKYADLILLDDDFQIHKTYLRGQSVFEKAT